MSLFDAVGMLGLWVYIAWHTLRLYQQGQFALNAAWGLLLAAGGLFTFRIIAIQTALDSLTAGRLPLGQWLRSSCVILAAECYQQLLAQILASSPSLLPQVTRRFNPLWRHLPLLTWLLTIAILAAGVAGLSYARTYYAIVLAVDAVALFSIATVYIPLNLAMLRSEQSAPLRLKQRATLLLCLLYTAFVLQFLPKNIEILQTSQMQPPTAKGPWVLLALACVIVQFIPFKYLTWLDLPRKYRLYWRLHRLERQVAAFTASPPRTPYWVRPKDLDMFIYTAVISILDNRPALPASPQSAALQQHISLLLPHHLDYETLTQALVESAHV